MGAGGDGSKYIGGLSATGQSPILNHYLLRQNARSAYHDTPQARAIVERFADTVISYGLQLESTPNADILGISAEEAESWASEINTRFHMWANSKKAMANESMNFYQSQRLVEICQQRDGEYFYRFYYSRRSDLLNPLQIGFLDPNQIRGFAYTNTYFPENYNDGINRDQFGKEISYDVWVRQKDGKYKTLTIPAYGSRSKRRMFGHGFQPEYPGQGRGYSRLSHALQEFENITDFSLAQIKKAINQSSITMYVKPSPDNPASSPFPNNTGVGPAAEAFGSLAGPVDAETAALVDPVCYSSLPEVTNRVPGSAGVFSLQEGEDLQPFKDTAPGESFDRFVDSFTAHLSASMSMPIEILLMRFNENYSASRASLILFWNVAKIWRQEIVADFLDPVFEAWLSGEIASGRIRAPGWQDPRMRAAWLACNFIGVPMPNIDPMRTAKANQIHTELGYQTLERGAREHNGTSAKSNMIKLQKEYGGWATPPWQKMAMSTKGGSA